MPSKIISFLFGAIVGAALCALIVLSAARRHTAGAVEAMRAEQTSAVNELQGELDAERARLKAAQAESDRIASRAEELAIRLNAKPAPASEPAKKKSGLAAFFGGDDGTNGASEGFSGVMKAAVEQQIEGKISGMKLRLNLTPDQETAVREILGKEMRRGTELAEKMFKGDMTMEEMQEAAKKDASPISQKDQIKALLTADQQEAYEAYEKEENQRMARLMANSELLQMQGTLHLDEAQQDKVYRVLAEQATAQFAGEGTPFDFTKMSDKKAESLKAVLTPEQFEEYKKFQEQQQKMIESFMPKSGTNGAAHGAIIIRANP